MDNKCIHIDPTSLVHSAEPYSKADLILLTRGHLKPKEFNFFENKTSVITADKCLKDIGGPLYIVKPGDSIDLRWVKIQAVNSYNVDSADPNKRVSFRNAEGVGFLIHIGGLTIYHTGDTDFIPEMRSLGNIDVVLLPIGGIFTMDIPAAVEAAKVLQPKYVIPMYHQQNDLSAFNFMLESQTSLKATVLEQNEPFILRS